MVFVVTDRVGGGFLHVEESCDQVAVVGHTGFVDGFAGSVLWRLEGFQLSLSGGVVLLKLPDDDHSHLPVELARVHDGLVAAG